MSFWDIVWFIVISFAFIAYLMVLFSIITDMFRDREMNGWVKAVWIVFLIFVPFLTALIYLVVRGRGMAERSMEYSEAVRAQQEQYIKQVASSNGGSGGAADEIARAKALLDAQVISEAEFQSLKAKALQKS